MNKTDMTAHFSDYLAAPPRLSRSLNADCFLATPYERNADSDGKLITILSGGSVKAEFPYHFSLKPLHCYMLLYTEDGYGKLHLDNTIHSLESGSLLFLDCSRPMKIEIAISPWNYKVFFLEGALLDFYYRNLPKHTFPLFFLPDYSPILRSIDRLVLNSTGAHIRNKLLDSRLLNDIFSDLLLDNIEEEQTKKRTPVYLTEMKALFDLDYQQNYTLDELEEHFSISKYRLCREFHAAFGLSPLQYLNEKRIDIARDLLLTTDYRIHEIGSLVGIDNTNHFINLFKKKTGMTPLAFRRK